MPFPFILAGGLLLKGASGIISGIAARKEAEANAEAAEYNADTAVENSKLVTRKWVEDVRRERVLNRRTLGSMKAAYGASGVTMENSAMDVLENSFANGEMNASYIEQEGRQSAAAYLREANMQRKRAKYYREGGTLSSAGALIGAGADIATHLKRG
jgi:hypothetical protein